MGRFVIRVMDSLPVTGSTIDVSDLSNVCHDQTLTTTVSSLEVL